MFLSDQTMKLLMELDAPPEQKVALLLSMRQDEEAARPVQSKGAARQATYRAKKALEAVTEHNAVTLGDAERNEPSAPLSPPPSPRTPLPPPPIRESDTTREAREREDAAWVRFWANYPRKSAKADARKAFAKAWRKLPLSDAEQVLTGALERAKASWTEAQFIPHAATWLNGERWQDEPSEVITLAPRKAPHERPDPDAKFNARQANHADAFEGARRAAGRDWKP